MKPVITAYSATNCLGAGVENIVTALRDGVTGLKACSLEGVEFETWVGEVEGLAEAPIEGPLSRFDCRNARLARLGLEQDGFMAKVSALVTKYGAKRVGLVMGTSTSGIAEGERAFAERAGPEAPLPDWYDYQNTHDIHATTAFVSTWLGIAGPAYTVSTACSASAKIFADARQLLASGLCDAVVVGGVDSLCLLTLYGFRSLELTDTGICRPNDADRAGLSIGEAAGFAILLRPEEASGALAVLEGIGESSDAHHMSSPHPEGKGARLSMIAAMQDAGLEARDVDYINLHGTGSRVNDTVEARAVMGLFGDSTPCSSTKGWTGHTLGAAGITEAVISLLAIREGFLPGNLNLHRQDPEIRTNVLANSADVPVRRVLSNSFGFGGNNCSLLFGSVG